MNTTQAIQATRRHFADNCRACIEEAQSGAVKVNDLPSYIAWREDEAANWLAGEYDTCFTARLYAQYLLTGECLPLLP